MIAAKVSLFPGGRPFMPTFRKTDGFIVAAVSGYVPYSGAGRVEVGLSELKEAYEQDLLGKDLR